MQCFGNFFVNEIRPYGVKCVSLYGHFRGVDYADDQISGTCACS